MEASVNITVAEVLAALADAEVKPSEPDGCFTREELADATGWHKEKVLANLKVLVRARRATVVTVERQDMTGRWQKKPGYRLMAVP